MCILYINYNISIIYNMSKKILRCHLENIEETYNIDDYSIDNIKKHIKTEVFHINNTSDLLDCIPDIIELNSGSILVLNVYSS